MVQKIVKAMTAPSRDRLFEVDTVQEDFIFNERVVEVFDDMLDRSIPFYKEVIGSSARLLDIYLNTDDTVYDLGCSTGTTLLEFSRLLQDKGLKFVGIDSSNPMLEKARLKVELYKKQDSISFQEEDITSMHHTGVGAFILNYTLQFIRPLRREAFLKTSIDPCDQVAYYFSVRKSFPMTSASTVSILTSIINLKNPKATPNWKLPENVKHLKMF